MRVYSAGAWARAEKSAPGSPTAAATGEGGRSRVSDDPIEFETTDLDDVVTTFEGSFDENEVGSGASGWPHEFQKTETRVAIPLPTGKSHGE